MWIDDLAIEAELEMRDGRVDVHPCASKSAMSDVGVMRG